MAEYDEALLRARALLSAGNVHDAFVTLRSLLDYPGMIKETSQLTEVLTVFADISAGIAGDTFAERVREAAEKPEDATALLPRIFALPDRNSQILAAATAHALNLPLENWPKAGSEAPGLVVAYDLAYLDKEVLLTLFDHHPDQILWSHAACWTSMQPLAADLTTFLYQTNHAPWGEHLAIDSETYQAKMQGPDERESNVLAMEIISATLEPDSPNDLPMLVNLVRAASAARGEQTFGFLNSSGERQIQWASSPVPSNFFL